MANKYSSKDTIKNILDVSTKLFVEKGYEKTTIQDIVKALDGLSRGAIYHHFKSKEEIINGVIRRLVPDSNYIDAISERKDLNGLEKIQHLLIETLLNKEVGTSFESAFSLFDNPKFFTMYMIYNNEVLSPQIELYINEGNKDGSLDVKFSKQISEIIVLILNTWFIVSLFPDTVDTFWDKIYASKYVLDSIGIDVLSDEVIERIISEMKGREIENEQK